MNIEQASQIYDILVQYAGAPEIHKQNFIHNQISEFVSEWRFCGHLGFGGKFRRSGDEIYVDCYPEDEDDRRKEIINTTNAMLKAYMGSIS
jgi:hypothetical protein